MKKYFKFTIDLKVDETELGYLLEMYARRLRDPFGEDKHYIKQNIDRFQQLFELYNAA